MVRHVMIASLAALMVSGCAPTVPRLLGPERVVSFCAPDQTPKVTAIESIVSSTGDKAEDFPVPAQPEIAKITKSTGGVLAHWNDQDLYSPNVAKQLGYPGTLAKLTDAAISNRAAGVDSRRVYLTFKLPDGTAKTLAFRGYDMQDVCSDGKLSP